MATMDVKSFYGKRSVKNKFITRIIPVESDDSQLSSDNEPDEDYNPPAENGDSSEGHSNFEDQESQCLQLESASTYMYDEESNLPTTSTKISKTKGPTVKCGLLSKTAKDNEGSKLPKTNPGISNTKKAKGKRRRLSKTAKDCNPPVQCDESSEGHSDFDDQESQCLQLESASTDDEESNLPT